MAVADVAIRIEVPRLVDDDAGVVGHGGVEPHHPLRIEPGRHIVTIRPVLDFDPTLHPPVVRPLDDHLSQLIARLQHLQPLPPHLGQQIQVVAQDVRGVVPIIRLDPPRRKLGVIGDLLLKFVGAPTCVDVEGQPLAERRQFLRLGVVRKDTGVDDGVVRSSEHVVRPLPYRRLAIADPRGRAHRVPIGHTGVLAHMAVLAGRPGCGGGCVFVFAERLFESESIHQVDVVACATQTWGR